jgi:Fe2+ transport system protein B
MSDDIDNAADAGNKAPDDANKATNQDGQKKVYDEEYVNTVKAESIARGKKLKEVEEKLKKFEDEKLTEAEKDKKKIADLEAEKLQILNERKEEKIDNLILKKSTGKNVVDIDALMMFAKKELADVENVDDKAVESVIEKILKEKAYLVSNSDVIPGDGNFKKNDNEIAKDPDKLMSDFLHDT